MIFVKSVLTTTSRDFYKYFIEKPDVETHLQIAASIVRMSSEKTVLITGVYSPFKMVTEFQFQIKSLVFAQCTGDHLIDFALSINIIL